ncbi:MFS transporter [Sporolactobacillus pectinivorans]|uniref:MFS transporter n=1 Tax=Sporolactobacillus pectinivorans TaxID=1591408 RepID=UPI000C2623CB|nr:MFS transporter [Sporolactobacillus pectinivorans]
MMNGLLKNRQFLLLLGGQGISIFGDQIYYIGLMWTIMKQTGSAMSLGMSVICMTLPSILVMPWAGVFADRNIKKQILMISDFVRGLVMFVIAVLTLEGHFSLITINLFLVMISAMNAFFSPALSSTVPLVLDKNNLSAGNAIFEFIRRFSTILGPVIGGILISVLSISSVFVLNGLSFIISFFFSLFLKIPPINQPGRGESFFTRFKEGLFYTFRMKRLLCLTLVGGVIINFFLAPIEVFLVVISHQLRFGSTGLGWMDAAISIGALLGSVIILFSHISNQIRLSLAGLVLEGTALILAGLLPNFIPLTFFFGLLGLGISFASIGIGTTFQLITEDDKRGRVNSFNAMLGSCTVPLGALFGSFLTGQLSVPWILLCFGLIVACSGMTLYFPFKEELHGIRKIRSN